MCQRPAWRISIPGDLVEHSATHIAFPAHLIRRLAERNMSVNRRTYDAETVEANPHATLAHGL